MNIAYVRLTQMIDLHPEEYNQRFAPERFGIFERLIKHGHNIIIYSDLTVKSENLLNEIKNGKKCIVNGKDYSWLKYIKIKSSDLPVNEDLLWIEHGAVNTMFTARCYNGVQLLRIGQYLKSFKGKAVLIYEPDPDLHFPYHKLFFSKYDFSYKYNPYNIGTNGNTDREGRFNFKYYDDLEDYGWADYEDLFDGKKIVIHLAKTIDKDLIVEKQYGNTRSKLWKYIEKGYINLESIPSAYDSEIVNNFKFNKNPEYDIFYAGYPRHTREKDWQRLIWGIKDLHVVVTGVWNKKKIEKLLITPNMIWLGNLKGELVIPKVCNNSYCILQLGTKKSKIFKYITNRHLEAVFSKSICFYDKEYDSMEKYLGTLFAVSSSEELKKKVNVLKSLPFKIRKRLWKYQYELCKNYGYDWYVSELEKIFEKYGLINNFVKYKWQEPNLTIKHKKALKQFNKLIKETN